MGSPVEDAVSAILAYARTRPIHEYWFGLPDERMRIALHPDEAVPSLVPALSDPSPEVRRFVAHLLHGLGTESARLALRGVLRDPSAGVRLEAARALVGEGHPVPDWNHSTPVALAPLLRQALIASLRPLLASSRLVELDDAARLLVRISDDGLAEALRARVPVDDWNLQNAVFRGISYASGGGRVLVELCAHPDVATRRTACMTLGFAKHDAPHGDVLATLVARLDDADAEVREAAARALGWFGAPAAEEPLLALLAREPTSGVLDALSRLKSRRALPALLERARLAGDAQATAIEALGRYGPDPSIEDALLALLDGADAHRGARLAQSLGEVGSARSVEPLRRLQATRARGASKRQRASLRHAIAAALQKLHARG